MTFILNVVASIVAAVLVVVGAGVLSTRVRGLFTAITTKWLGLDVEYVFKDKDDSQKDLSAELKRSREISILAGKGNELQRPTFSSIFLASSGQRRTAVRILLPATSLPDEVYDWTWQREQELAAFDPAYGKDLLKQLINANVQYLLKHAQSGNVELRRFNAPHLGRVIVTEHYAYYTPYRADAHARESQVYKFRRGGEMYDNLRRLFEQLWQSDETQRVARTS